MQKAALIFQDGIIPYFESIMTPLKGFLNLDETNPDSNTMFNQCLDTLARYLTELVSIKPLLNQ